ncbi:hypothetical protein DQ04_27221000, partial [Trypanosoma grayi]|uniref:hypothetical protein n=1 Tax=Trypanosoma grayi TaxID=71804 RepID=UPI0004F4739A
ARYATDALGKATEASQLAEKAFENLNASFFSAGGSQGKAAGAVADANNAVSHMEPTGGDEDYAGAVPLCDSAAASAEATKALAQKFGAEAAEAIRFAHDALLKINEATPLAGEASKKAA